MNIGCLKNCAHLCLSDEELSLQPDVLVALLHKNQHKGALLPLKLGFLSLLLYDRNTKEKEGHCELEGIWTGENKCVSVAATSWREKNRSIFIYIYICLSPLPFTCQRLEGKTLLPYHFCRCEMNDGQSHMSRCCCCCCWCCLSSLIRCSHRPGASVLSSRAERTFVNKHLIIINRMLSVFPVFCYSPLSLDFCSEQTSRGQIGKVQNYKNVSLDNIFIYAGWSSGLVLMLLQLQTYKHYPCDFSYVMQLIHLIISENNSPVTFAFTLEHEQWSCTGLTTTIHPKHPSWRLVTLYIALLGFLCWCDGYYNHKKVTAQQEAGIFDVIS